MVKYKETEISGTVEVSSVHYFTSVQLQSTDTGHHKGNSSDMERISTNLSHLTGTFIKHTGDLTILLSEADQDAKIMSHGRLGLLGSISLNCSWKIEEIMEVILKASAEHLPGLPTRAELIQWLVEHNVVEKETEIFDTSELKKLWNFMRAVAPRYLSAEDIRSFMPSTNYYLLQDHSETLDFLRVQLS
ncbi:hypothetical protein BT96DRAFT_949039 [Gymnopus androsaceus JB14]|uniref:Uncharacterized protein n=1 Tax=Gymnopus androsaceus JB14 TaxID=1447944 RepID=A0A6A4GM49_9AGAR|nr:hypothetical protein BT96DRAFT_949039 [Gymnopus androsaceus JB14]